MALGLKLFSRTSKRGCYNLASYHSPHSLTWSWVLSVDLDRYWPRLSCGKVWKGQWSLGLPFVVIRLHWQEPMWFRDLYWKRAA